MILSEESIIRFPFGIGLTGRAIQKRKILVSQQGEREKNSGFRQEIDNFKNVARVRNIMIGPIFDIEGEVRGAIQFINKIDKEQIKAQDEIEL